MPQLVASAAVTFFTGAGGATAASFAGAAAASAATAAVYATAYIATTAAIVAGTQAYSSSQSAKLRRSFGTDSIDQGRTVMVRDPAAPRRLIYGQALVSGPIVFVHTTGTKNEFLHLVIVLAGHEVEEIGDIYFNDEIVPLSGNVPVGKYAAVALVNKKRGVAGDTADADLVAAAPSFWTTDHKLGGCAYLALKLKWSADLFPNGMPTIKALVKGKKVYDPRSTLTEWSANAALCAADFISDSSFGKGVAFARIRSADLIEAANICDEAVVLADASSEDRYTCNGTILSSQDPSSVLFDLASAMAGHIVDTGGTWTVRAGAYRAPALTLTDDDLVGSFAVQPRQSRQDTFNRVRGLYIAEVNQWAAADFPHVSNVTYKANDGGIWLDRDVQYNFTTSAATAQRLAKIELERGRQQITVSAPYTLKAMQAMPGDTVAITRAKLGWTAKEFEVIEWAFLPTGSGENVGLAVEMNLRETAEGVWDWADGEETEVDAAPNTDLPDPFTVGTPTITLLSDSTTVTVQPDGTVMPRLKVSWTTPNDIHVESGGFVEIEFKKTADSDYTVWTAARGDALFDYILDVKIGVTYNVRARFRNNAGVRGAYDTETSSAVVGDTTVPVAPSGLVATAMPGYIDLLWAPSTTNTVNEYAIHRSIVSAVAGFALLANTANSQYQDAAVTVGVPYWYQVYAVTRSEVSSATSGVVTATAINPAVIDTTPPGTPAVFAISGTAQPAVYETASGQLVGRRIILLPAMPTLGKWMNLLFRINGGSNYSVAAQSSVGAIDIPVDDLAPGASYDFAVQAFSAFGIGSALRTITGSPLVIPGSLAAPTATTGFTAVAYPGYIDLFWYPSASNTVNEYQIHRSITSAVGGFGAIADTPNNQFQDVNVVAGTQYWYKVFAISASEIASTGFVANASAGVVALIAPDGELPATPTAPAQPGPPVVDTYDATDGSVYSFVTLELAALPARAKFQNLKYRRTGATEWLIAGQYKNTAALTVALGTAIRLDDLSPGIGYDICTQAFNSTGGSAEATGTPFTAATKTSGPAVPTSFTHVAGNNASYARPPSTLGTTVGYSCRNNWTAPSDKDLIGYEWAILGATGSDPVGNGFFTSEAEAISVLSGPVASYLYVRSKNRSGYFSAWVTDSVNLNTSHLQPAGEMMMQAPSAVAVTGGTVTGITDITVADGGTGASTAAGARSNLLPTLAGNAAKVLAVNAGATDAEWIAATGTGTVTSVAGAGTVNGLTLTGTVTTTGSLTLGGTLSGVNLASAVTGALPIANGGTGGTLGVGTLGTQAANNVSITGGYITDISGFRISTGATAIELTAIYSTNEVITLSGGATAEVVSIDITARGFAAKPDTLIVNVEHADYGAYYDQTHASNSSTTAKIVVFRYDGANCSAGTLRVDILALAF